MIKQFILAIDQGTSSTKTIIFDEYGNVVSKGVAELQTNYFDNGFVEQDAEEIYQNVLDSLKVCIEGFESQGFSINDIISCGISNQRETFVLWDENGTPQAPAVVWACKRSVEICERLKAQEPIIQQKTGLIIDPYFSGTKLLWLIENDTKLQSKLAEGKLYFGTVDCWLLYKLSGKTVYKTDYTNASRTLLFNIHTLTWDTEILKLWGLEKLNLPETCPSSSEFGFWVADSFTKLSIRNPNSQFPIHSMIGDSHAASFGEGCFEAGSAKATLGTGCSILLNIGKTPTLSKNGMLTTICWSTPDRVDYALEGAIVSCGSSIEWLKNELHLFQNPSETERMAKVVSDNAGVYLIPAFSGLGAPHWQMNRRASIEGMTLGTTKNHIVRAALESIPYQIKDVLDAMQADTQIPLSSLSVNGGMTNNSFITQFLSDLLQISLKKQQTADVSALGAAYLSGLQSGVFENIEAIKRLNQSKNEEISPNLSNQSIKDHYKTWCELIK